MGLVLLPVYFGAFVIWLVLFIRFIILLFKEEFATYWSFLIALAIIPLLFCTLLWDWSTKTEMWVLEPLFQLPINMVILPGLFAFMLSFVSPSRKMVNAISFALLIAVLLSGLLIFIPYFQDPNNFFDIEMTH